MPTSDFEPTRPPFCYFPSRFGASDDEWHALKQVPGVIVSAAAFPGNADNEVIMMSLLDSRFARGGNR